MTSSTNAEPTSETLSSKQSTGTSNKNHLSPSSSSKRKRLDDGTVSPPPEKKRRSSITEQSLQAAQSKVLSPSIKETGEASNINSTSTSDRSRNGRGATARPTIQSESVRDGETSLVKARSSEARHNHRASTDRNHITDSNHYRDSDRTRRPTSRQRHQDGDRYTPPAQNSRTRSPIRRRSPNPNTRSAYGRRDPPPPRRRSRSPSPICRSPHEKSNLFVAQVVAPVVGEMSSPSPGDWPKNESVSRMPRTCRFNASAAFSTCQINSTTLGRNG